MPPKKLKGAIKRVNKPSKEAAALAEASQYQIQLVADAQQFVRRAKQLTANKNWKKVRQTRWPRIAPNLR